MTVNSSISPAMSRVQAVNARHTVPHFKDGPDFIDVNRRQIARSGFP